MNGSASLRVDARHEAGVTIARPAGTLDAQSYAELRDTLLKYAADEPDALLVELTELEMPSVSALTVFSLVSMRTADWPGIPVMLVAERMDQRLMLGGSPIRRFVAVHDSVPAAIAAIGKPPARSRATIELPPSPMSARRVRHFVRLTCQRWQVPELVEGAVTIASALVENTLQHTDSAAFVRLELRNDLLTVAVSDTGPRPPFLRERVEGGVAPTGILLVAATAWVWGSTPTMTGGKTVWAILRRKRRMWLAGEDFSGG